MTFNEEFFDASVRHQIDLLRFGSGVARQVNALLDETRADLRAQVERRLGKVTGITGASLRRLRELERAIDQTRSGAWNDVTESWTRTAVDVALEEPLFMAGVATRILPVELDLVQPSAGTLRALATTRPFQGRHLKEWAQSAQRADLQRIHSQIRIGMVQGESARDIAARVFGARGAMNITRHQAEAVTRTVINGVSNAAQQEFLRENSDLFDFEQYCATLDSRTTILCAGLDGKQFPVGKGPVPPQHVNCLPGDALVSSRGRISAVSKRWYAGNVVVITTAAGRELTCTPNHPVLTDRGWVPAGLVDERCRVVCDLRSERPCGAENEREQAPTRIEEIARAFGETPGVIRRRAPVAAKDFHGDGTEGEVEIVAADSGLLGELQSPSFDELLEGALQVGHIGQSRRTDARSLGEVILRIGAGGGAVGGIEHAPPLLVGGIRPSLAHLSADSVPVGLALPAQTTGILAAAIDSSGLEQEVDRCGAALLVLCKLLDRSPGEIAFDDVVGVSKNEFRGHVYNLETSSGHYVAHGIVVHNCRSIRVAALNGEVIGERPFKGGTEQQMLREYSARHGLGKVTSRDDLPRGHKSAFDAFSRRRMRELTGQVPARTTYQEWLKRQPADIQDDILGPARGKLFREGGLTLDRFVGREGDELTLEELRRRNRGAWERAGLGGAGADRAAEDRRSREAEQRERQRREEAERRQREERARREEAERRAEEERKKADLERRRREGEERRARAAEAARRQAEEESARLREQQASAAAVGARTGEQLVAGTQAKFQLAGPANEITEAAVRALDRVGFRQLHQRIPGHLHMTDRVIQFKGEGKSANRLRGYRTSLEDNSVPESGTAYYASGLRMIRMSSRVQDYAGSAYNLKEVVDTTKRMAILPSETSMPVDVPGGTIWIAKTAAQQAEMVAVHEFGHAVHMNDADPILQRQIDSIVLKHYYAPKREATSTYGDENREEFFAEAFTAYWHYPPGWMARNAPRSLEMVEEVIRLRGLPLNPAARGGQRE